LQNCAVTQYLTSILVPHGRNGTLFFGGSAIQGGSYSLEKKKSENPGDNTFEFRVRFTESFNNDPYANFYTEFPMIITFDACGVRRVAPQL